MPTSLKVITRLSVGLPVGMPPAPRPTTVLHKDSLGPWLCLILRRMSPSVNWSLASSSHLWWLPAAAAENRWTPASADSSVHAAFGVCGWAPQGRPSAPLTCYSAAIAQLSTQLLLSVAAAVVGPDAIPLLTPVVAWTKYYRQMVDSRRCPGLTLIMVQLHGALNTEWWVIWQGW